MPIAWWFSEQFSDNQDENDYVFLGALRNPVNGWITPGNAGTSAMITELLAGNGDMAQAFRDYVPDQVIVPKPDQSTQGPYTFKQILSMWVDDGCRIHNVAEPSLTAQKQAGAKGRLTIREKGKPGAPAPEIAPPAQTYVRPHRVYGMGVPH